jgi:hypothetical protein
MFRLYSCSEVRYSADLLKFKRTGKTQYGKTTLSPLSAPCATNFNNPLP